jgi:LPS export ABC transporter permease LptF/LPS export ABC transporter permease LptG
MRLLDRYIFREVVSHTILGLAVFTFVFFVPQLVRLMDLVVRHSEGFGTVLLLILCTLPPILGFTLPMAVLVGVLIGLGRLSADSEIVALHACGVSLRRLLVPVGFIAIVAGAATLATTFWLSPVSVRTGTRLEVELASSQAPFAVQPRVFDERFPHFVLYVQDVEAAATRWRGVFLASSGNAASGLLAHVGAGSTAKSAAGESAITIAENAQIISGGAKGQIELHLGSGSVHEYNPQDPARYDVTTFGEMDIPIEISPAVAAQTTNTMVKDSARSVASLLADHGPGWRDARVEFERRIAFPIACVVFALLGVPIGVRPRRGGRAAGLILTLALIGGYYFLFVYGYHTALQGRIAPWAGVWAANIVTTLVGLFFLSRVENIRRPSRILARIETLWRRSRAPASGNPNGVAARAMNGAMSLAQPAVGLRRAIGAGWASAFPTLVDVYLLQQFLYFFFVLLAGFVLIFDAFTLFDLLADIARNHIEPLTVLNYFRFLIPLMTYQLAPLATLVATLVTLSVLAKNNEVIAFKASGISLYRLVLPLLLAGCLIAGGIFLLDDTYLPYANQRQDALRDLIKGRPAQTYREPAHQWIFGEGARIYNYQLFDPDQRLFGGLNVFELDPKTFQMRRRVFAERAVWDPSQEAWVLTGGWIRDFDSDGHVTLYQPFTATSLPELTEPPSYFQREVRQYYQMNWRELGQYIAGLRQAGFDTARLSVQWQKKFAFPLIAAIIIFLSAPFAFLTGTRGAVGGVAVAVGIGVVYWATSALFEALGSVGQLPPILAGWAPDAIFGFLGAYFFLRMPT